MGRTEIAWTDFTLNPGIYGCSHAGTPACDSCYAMGMAHRLVAMGRYPAGITRLGPHGPVWTGKVVVDYDRIGPAFAALPKRGPARVFVTSMGDLFHRDVPDAFIERVFHEMADRRHLVFQVLTKRPERIPASIGWPRNVWAGATVENQDAADRRVPHLLRVPAAVRFVSVEPMLGHVNLAAGLWRQPPEGTPDESPEAGGLWRGPVALGAAGIGWVIAGCESGPRRRPTEWAWVRSLRDQCVAANVAYFLKQMPTADGRGVESLPELDGQRWAQLPEVSP